MNLYIRYFDEEVLVYSVEEALNFLSSLEDVEVDEEMVSELEKFMSSTAMYPKHIKVHARSFFIVIKTTANTLEEFKAKGAGQIKMEKAAQKEAIAQYSKSQPGWYSASILFKRVITLPETQKCHYVDTPFACKVKAESAQDCYEKVISHLRSRGDIDTRSQFPSIKSANFEWNYLGE
ncbi:MAG: hypothetical protein IK144_02680 [Bacteroidaceae bacterium]|nr:hypothetical protein [Bacteroidaceae bacterium]